MLSTMLFQVVTVKQCCNNMLTILFIVSRTTLFTPVDISKFIFSILRVYVQALILKLGPELQVTSYKQNIVVLKFSCFSGQIY